MKPSLHFRPLRPAVAADGATTLDLLITVSAPALSPERQARPRQPLNLALVIDRSGSMSGSKLSYARKAARFLVGELSERDRLAIVTFDDEVEVLVPSQPVSDPQVFIRAINTKVCLGFGKTDRFDCRRNISSWVHCKLLFQNARALVRFCVETIGGRLVFWVPLRW